MSNPTFVLAPGAAHSAAIYSQLQERLHAKNYSTIAVNLPSAGADPPLTSRGPDIAAIRDPILRLVEQEHQDVILAIHSYAGIPGSEAPRGLGKRERQSQGLQGGVLRVVYLSATAMPEGFQPSTDPAGFPEWMTVNTQEGTVIINPGDAREVMYNDLPQDEAELWISRLVPQSLNVYTGAQSWAAWQHIPSTYVRASRDNAVPPAAVDQMLQAARQIEPTAFDVVEEQDGGHCLMISQPYWLAGVLINAAGGVES